MTEEEKNFLSDPTPLKFGTLKFVETGTPDTRNITKSWINRNLENVKKEIWDSALKRWILALDDATKMSCNLTDFTDVELAGLRYMLSKWDIERLKKFKAEKGGCQ